MILSSSLSVFSSSIQVVSTEGYSCNLSFFNRTMPCSLGTNGVISPDMKEEGDGKTPSGSYLLRQVYYRADHISKPNTGGLSNVTNILHPNDGWCDDSQSLEYNMHINLPYVYHHENLWEIGDVHFYDLFAVIGYNDSPPIPGKGSAIFFHTTIEYGGTAGCVALSLIDLEWVLARVEYDTYIEIA